MATTDIAVIGGGIGGLTAAIALRRKGIDARVYERAPALREVGAGIWMPPNAMQVFDRLGIAADVQAAGQPIVTAEVYDRDAGLLGSMDIRAAARVFGFTNTALHRAALQQVLARHVGEDALQPGHELRGLEQLDDRVRLTFANGSTLDARLVVGADGARSTVRAHLFPHARLRYSGQTSYRAVTRHLLPAAFQEVSREIWGPGCRFGFSAIGQAGVYWYATRDAPEGETESAAEMKRRLAELARGFPEPVPELVATTDADAITRTDLHDLPPLRTWHDGRVVLLGDAAHATTPNLGQGGAQAVEDAYVLAEQLAAHADHAGAFAAYERVRMATAYRVVRVSRRLGRVAHIANPIGRRLRNLLLRSTPDAVVMRQMMDLYGLKY